MKWPHLASLLAVAALTSCSTMHDAAVSTFRVVDAPNAYLRRKLGVEREQASPNPTTETRFSDTASNRPPQPSPIQSPEAPVQGREPEPPAEAAPNETPRVAARERIQSPRITPPNPSAPPRTASTQKASDIPYGKPVPGKPGYVFSPYDKNGGYVDVTGFAPGQQVKDPYTGKIFLVP